MKRFVEGVERSQSTFLPESLDDFVGEDNAVRVVDIFVDGLDLRELGFERVDPKSTGRPSYHPSVLLKLYIYGYLNRVQSSRRLEREAARNVEAQNFAAEGCVERPDFHQPFPFPSSRASVRPLTVGGRPDGSTTRPNFCMLWA